jgi:hypothetical protein
MEHFCTKSIEPFLAGNVPRVIKREQNLSFQVFLLLSFARDRLPLIVRLFGAMSPQFGLKILTGQVAAHCEALRSKVPLIWVEVLNRTGLPLIVRLFGARSPQFGLKFLTEQGRCSL